MMVYSQQLPVAKDRHFSNTPATGVQLLPLLFRTEQQYGWSVGMRAITHALLAPCTIPPGPVADIGCGGGRMAEGLSAAYPCRRVYGVDLNSYALAHAATIRSNVKLTQADLTDLPFADGQLALLLALDAYDQQGVHIACALAESLRVLRPGGVMVLRVSAKPWLKGPHDTAFNTGKRYEANEISRALIDAGFTPERITFANMLLSLPQGALRLLQRWRMLPLLPSLYTARAVNVPLAMALSLEARWLRRRNLPGGLSLYAIARKRLHGNTDQNSTTWGTLPG